MKNGFVSVVTSPHVKGKTNVDLHEGDYTKHTKLAVWFGNEKRGISELAVEHCEMCVAIPMFGMIENLNLGTSSGIVLYEVTKQRREYQSKYRRRKKRGGKGEPASDGDGSPSSKVRRGHWIEPGRRKRSA